MQRIPGDEPIASATQAERRLIKNEWILAYFRADQEDEDSLWFDQDVREGFLAGAETRRSERASVDSVDGIRARAS